MRLVSLALVAVTACRSSGVPNTGSGAPNAGSATGSAAPAKTGVDDLSAQLETLRAAHHLPAIAMLVARHGMPIATGVAGVRKLGDAAHAATLADQWHLGSDTKAMTATLIGIYVDKGALRWDDTLGKLFEHVDPGYAKVTLDQLLQHRGGAPAEPPADVWAQAWKDGAAPDARAKFVAAILAKPPAQPPGTFAYSNAGYMIAGAALERATKQSWEQLMRAELFAPLGMASCGFGAPGDASTIDQPWGHDGDTPMSPADPHADNPPALGPAGTVHCSLADWTKFLAVHASPATQKLVMAATLGHLHAAPTLDSNRYMGGWMVVELSPTDVRFAHEGSNTMWHAIAVVIPALDVTIAVAANKHDDQLFAAIAPLVQPYLRAP